MMKKKTKNVLIIGAGIHGCFLAKYLNKFNINIFLIERNKDICLEASGATHNRANRGFHYPRSKETISECKIAYDYFEKEYNAYLKKRQSFYCIEKKSKVSFKDYIFFFKKNKLKYKIIKKSKFIKNNNLEGIVRAEEGCYNHSKLKFMLKKKLTQSKIKIFYNFNLNKIKYQNKVLTLISDKKKLIKNKIDVIVNATYDSSNQVLKKFFAKKHFSKYLHQLTEVVIVKSKVPFPGITIMDGPFATIMPLTENKNKYLLYDVTNSILKTSNRPIPKRTKKSNYSKIKSKLSKYVNFTENFKYVSSSYGNRPTPIKDANDDRSTKIIENYYKKNIKLISIREGKYISAPYVAHKLSKKIISYLNEK